jgi:catechol 2,3-dioxygenase-like lactoylglutathione lyase family enzyme
MISHKIIPLDGIPLKMALAKVRGSRKSGDCAQAWEKQMFVYTTLGVTDFERSIRFYDAVMATIGVGRAPDWTDGYKGWGVPYEQGNSLWICKPWDGLAMAAGNGVMIALRAETEQQVQDFHAAALANGGRDEGKAGLRPDFGPSFYACYVRDPDGNKLACVRSRLTGEATY